MKKYLILILLITSSCYNQNSIENNIDKIFQEFKPNHTPGVSVAVLKDGNIVYQKGFGLANIETKVLIEPKTNFRLASITKQFTALSILLLEQDRKLSLSDTLTNFFSDFPKYGNKITIKNILQHTSGLVDYENFVNKTDTIQLKDKDVLNILMEQDSTYFEPGAKHKYSNSGYAILAILIEKLSGKTYAKFLNSRIFKPLKMNNSIAYEKGISEIINRSYGYSKSDSGFVFSDQSLTSAVLGDGGIYSSTIDLIKWNSEVNSPTLLPEEKFNRVFQKGKDSNGQEFDYGFGWRLDPYKNYVRHYHTGGTSGFSNIYMKLPELDLTVIVLINVNNFNAKKYAEKIANLFIK
ncbi:MAG: serine hydrolase domain-containing protein [Melioribacteraceae bacterium]